MRAVCGWSATGCGGVPQLPGPERDPAPSRLELKELSAGCEPQATLYKEIAEEGTAGHVGCDETGRSSRPLREGRPGGLRTGPETAATSGPGRSRRSR